MSVLGLAALIFVVQNSQQTRFRFLWMEFHTPLWVMLVVFAAVGAVVFWALARRRRKRRGSEG